MRTVELKRKLQKYGCYFLTNGKNHEWWYSPITDQKFQVPRHASEDIRTPLKKTNKQTVWRRFIKTSNKN